MIIYIVENNELKLMIPPDEQATEELLAERASSTATVAQRFAQGECALIAGRWLVPEQVFTTRGMQPVVGLKVQVGKQGPANWIQFLDGDEIIKRGVVAVAKPMPVVATQKE